MVKRGRLTTRLVTSKRAKEVTMRLVPVAMMVEPLATLFDSTRRRMRPLLALGVVCRRAEGEEVDAEEGAEEDVVEVEVEVEVEVVVEEAEVVEVEVAGVAVDRRRVVEDVAVDPWSGRQRRATTASVVDTR